jgi:hypothetical protein
VRSAALLLATSLVLVACGDDAGSSDPIALEDGTASDGGGAADGGGADGDDPAGNATDGGATTEPDGGVVDASVAEPGTWQVGEAGIVTFSLQEGRLVLDDVSPADGWTVTAQEADGDELDVDLERRYRVTGNL